AAILEAEVSASASCWLAARAWGDMDPVTGEKPAVHTTPVYVRVGDLAQKPSRAAFEFVSSWLGRLKRTLAQLDETVAFASAAGRDHIRRIVERAQQRLAHLTAQP